MASPRRNSPFPKKAPARRKGPFFLSTARVSGCKVEDDHDQRRGVFRASGGILCVKMSFPRRGKRAKRAGGSAAPVRAHPTRTEPPRRGVPWPLPRGPVFDKFSIFLFFLFSFFFLGGWKALIGAGFQAQMGQKTRLAGTKNTSSWDKKHV